MLRLHLSVFAGLATSLLLPALPAASETPDPPSPPAWREQAIQAAEYILRCQSPRGAIRDAIESPAINMDNNMGYALVALAAAHEASADSRYLEGMRRGLTWLASVQDPDGAWHWGYRAADDQPFVGEDYKRLGITDIRGVDAVQAYFAYVLYLYVRVSGDEAFARSLIGTARRGVEYLILHNYDGRFFYSSWQEWGGRWRLLRQQYSAGQGDVYLGLLGLANLTGEARYWNLAGRLRGELPAFLVDGAWSTSRQARAPYPFSNGYLPYILRSPEGLEWLSGHQDGTAIAAAALALGRHANGMDPTAALSALERLQGPEGGVRFGDTAAQERSYYTNDAAFAILAWLGAPFGGPALNR